MHYASFASAFASAFESCESHWGTQPREHVLELRHKSELSELPGARGSSLGGKERPVPSMFRMPAEDGRCTMIIHDTHLQCVICDDLRWSVIIIFYPHHLPGPRKCTPMLPGFIVGIPSSMELNRPVSVAFCLRDLTRSIVCFGPIGTSKQGPMACPSTDGWVPTNPRPPCVPRALRRALARPPTRAMVCCWFHWVWIQAADNETKMWLDMKHIINCLFQKCGFHPAVDHGHLLLSVHLRISTIFSN